MIGMNLGGCYAFAIGSSEGLITLFDLIGGVLDLIYPGRHLKLET